MSFILDALRKSDARRQQSAAPGLNSPEPPRPPRRRRRLWPFFGVLLLVVGAAGASVYLLRPAWLPPALTGASEAPSESNEPSQPTDRSAESSREGAIDIRERLAQQHGTESGNDRRRLPAEPAGEPADSGRVANTQEKQDGQSEGSEQAAQPPGRRRPVPASPDRVVRREPQPERESAPVTASEASEELERRMAEEALRRRQERQGRADARPTTPPAERRSDAARGDRRRAEAGNDSAAASDSGELNEGVAEYVQAWELPLSVRRELPELNLTIHVFSPEAEQRFVLINGERYTMGDSIGEVDIVDIRREGALVDFRSHRFMLGPR